MYFVDTDYDHQPNGWFICLCLLYLFIMFIVQYWNQRDAEWRSTGSGTIYDQSHARSRMNALAAQCDHCVRFRIVDMSTL